MQVCTADLLPGGFLLHGKNQSWTGGLSPLFLSASKNVHQTCCAMHGGLLWNCCHLPLILAHGSFETMTKALNSDKSPHLWTYFQIRHGWDSLQFWGKRQPRSLCQPQHFQRKSHPCGQCRVKVSILLFRQQITEEPPVTLDLRWQTARCSWQQLCSYRNDCKMPC